jgi:parallel beta-helix repeat protein
MEGIHLKRINTAGILALLIALTVLMGPVSATTWNITSDMNNSVIQGYIDGATAGDILDFVNASATYNGSTGIALTVNKNNLTFLGNGATLVGGGSSIFTITGTNGVTIKDFIININNNTADGITGSNVYNCNITNNTIMNGDDGINIFMHYGGLIIANNTITDMNNGRDGISLVNHNTTIDMDTYAPTLIEGNTIDDVQYGIFLGGNFKGTITNNDVTGTVAGMNITGKRAATNGILNATICNNTINRGIAVEVPNISFLELCYNIITGVVDDTEYSILTNDVFATGDILGDIIVNFNYLGYNATDDFKDVTTEAHNNTGPGAYSVPP